MAIVLSRSLLRTPEMGSSPPFRLTARAATRPIGWRMPESRVSPTNATLNASFAGVRFRNGKDNPSLSISRLSNPASVAARAFSITVVSFCWRICLISESMGHHDSEIMDDGSID